MFLNHLGLLWWCVKPHNHSAAYIYNIGLLLLLLSLRQNVHLEFSPASVCILRWNAASTCGLILSENTKISIYSLRSSTSISVARIFAGNAKTRTLGRTINKCQSRPPAGACTLATSEVHLQLTPPPKLSHQKFISRPGGALYPLHPLASPVWTRLQTGCLGVYKRLRNKICFEKCLRGVQELNSGHVRVLIVNA